MPGVKGKHIHLEIHGQVIHVEVIRQTSYFTLCLLARKKKKTHTHPEQHLMMKVGLKFKTGRIDDH